MTNNNPQAIEEMAIEKLQLLPLWSTSRKIHYNKGETAAKQQKLEGTDASSTETQKALKISCREFASQTRAREMH